MGEEAAIKNKTAITIVLVGKTELRPLFTVIIYMNHRVIILLRYQMSVLE